MSNTTNVEEIVWVVMPNNQEIVLDVDQFSNISLTRLDLINMLHSLEF